MNDPVARRRVAYAAPPASQRRAAPAIGPAAIACLLVALVLGALAPPAAAQTDPRNPGAIALPEIGRMSGTLKCVTAMDESFGRQIYPIGDVNNDGIADWILTHRRCDTSFGGYAVIELLLYHGVRGGLPPTSAGIRIGPSEINADCSFLGAGDYDSDGHRDLALSHTILGDSLARGFSISSVVVFWNDGAGRFSVEDTTHLTSPNERVSIMTMPDYEKWARVPMECDVDGDGSEDLVVVTNGRHYIDGVRSSFPSVLIYRGHPGGARWGRRGVACEPAWRLWRRYYSRRVSLLDHDGDGALDIVMYRDEDGVGRRGGVAVCYGVRGALPDTVAEVVDFVRIGRDDPKRCEMIDVTGDRIPELIVSTGDTVWGMTWRWVVYVGRRGQRLYEQFGSGNDAPRPGDSLWWGRPWLSIQTPHAINPAWNGPMHPVLDAGDIGLDGTGDFCVYNYPSVNCYNGGRFLDSYIDAWMLVPLADLHDGWISRLGDIDGSGAAAIGVPHDGGGVYLFRASRSVPRTGSAVRLPEGSDKPVSAPASIMPGPPTVTVMPNPATITAQVRWKPTTYGTSVTLHDLTGHDLRRWLLQPGASSLEIDVADMPAGLYLVTLRSGERSTTLPLMIN